MRVLFVSYLLINDVNGNSLIGVYKRCIRIGLAMAERGHEVWILCPNHADYRDDLTALAQQKLRFLEIEPSILYRAPLEVRRQWCRLVFRRLKPDLVVAGEAPLGGIILEPVLWAAGAGVPLVILDNAYGPDFARRFVAVHGPIADGVILSGPSSFQMPDPPSFYCGVPPYLEGEPTAGERWRALHAQGAPLITVLGYDPKAEQLAAGLLTALAQHPDFRERPPRAIFFSLDPAGCRERLAARGLDCAVVMPPPAEDVLFGALAGAYLTIGKCGFMQISESLAVGTPFIGVYYRGCCPLFLLPAEAQQFVHAVPVRPGEGMNPSEDDIQAAARMLRTPRSALEKLHDASQGALRIAAEYLERLPRVARSETTAESAAVGYAESLIQAAIAARHPNSKIHVRSVRSSRLREEPWGHIDALVCRYWVDERSWCCNWWGRVYQRAEEGVAEAQRVHAQLPGRSMIWSSSDGRVLIEEMGDEAALPPIQI
jgi:hypothetical protein